MRLYRYFTILLLSVFVLYSCSSNSNSDEEHVAENTINPPEWLFGTWNALDASEVEIWTFNHKDLLMIREGVPISFDRKIEGFKNSGYSVFVSEIYEEDTYSIMMQFPNGDEIYSFQKASDDQILWLEAEEKYSSQNSI